MSIMRDFVKSRWKAQIQHSQASSGITPSRSRDNSSCVSSRKRIRECRNLFGEEQSISVIVRIRPPRKNDTERPNEPSACVVDVLDEDKMQLTIPPKLNEKSSMASLTSGSQGEPQVKQYHFTRVFPVETTQAEYYAGAAAALVEEMVVTHSNYVMLAYGITGAGKTFTLEGTQTHPGALPRALEHLFELLASSSSELGVCCTYYEVYNDHIYDLVKGEKGEGPGVAGEVPRPGSKGGELKVKEDSSGAVCIPGLTVRKVGSAKEGLALLARGSLLRTRAGTRLNAASSRSHAVFTVMLTLEHHPLQDKENGRSSINSAEVSSGGMTEGVVPVSKLSFVDMAGAERANRTQNQGARFKESVKINSSLLALGRCLEALRHNQLNSPQQPQLIPYRNSKLTHIFRDVLHGQGRIVLAVAVSPDECDASETANMLEYARAAKDIKTVQVQPAPQPMPVLSVSSGPSVAGKKRKVMSSTDRSKEATSQRSQLTRSGAFEVAEEMDMLQKEVCSLKTQLEEVRRSSEAQRLEQRRDLSRKMAAKLEEMEDIWKEKNNLLLEELERLTGSQQQLLEHLQRQQDGVGAWGGDEEERQRARAEMMEEVKLSLQHQHNRELMLLKESMQCEVGVMSMNFQAEKEELVRRVSRIGGSDICTTGAIAGVDEIGELLREIQQLKQDNQTLRESEQTLKEQVKFDHANIDQLEAGLQGLMQDKDEADQGQQEYIQTLMAKHEEELAAAREALELKNSQNKDEVETAEVPRPDGGSRGADSEEEVATLRRELEELERRATFAEEGKEEAMQAMEDLMVKHEQEVAAARAETSELRKSQHKDVVVTAEVTRADGSSRATGTEEEEVATLRRELEELERRATFAEEGKEEAMQTMEDLQTQNDCLQFEAKQIKSQHGKELKQLQEAHEATLAEIKKELEEFKEGQVEEDDSKVLRDAEGAEALEEELEQARKRERVLVESVQQLNKENETLVEGHNKTLDNLQEEKLELAAELETMKEELDRANEDLITLQEKYEREGAELEERVERELRAEFEVRARDRAHQLEEELLERFERERITQEEKMEKEMAEEWKLKLEDKEEEARRERENVEKDLKQEVKDIKSNLSAENDILASELKKTHAAKEKLTRDLEQATREKKELTELHLWETNLLKENLKVDEAEMEDLSEEFTLMLEEKKTLVEKLTAAKRENLSLSQQLEREIQLKESVDVSELMAEMRAKVFEELDKNYKKKYEDMKMELHSEQDATSLFMRNQQKEKDKIKKELLEAQASQKEMEEWINILSHSHPDLMQNLHEVNEELIQSMDADKWSNVLRQSLRKSITNLNLLNAKTPPKLAPMASTPK